MEPEIPLQQLWNFCITLVAPIVAFAIGVWISHTLKLNAGIDGKALVLLSIPVGLLVLGTLISTASTNDPREGNTDRLYGYCESFSKYMIFNGTVMFLGTSTPKLFNYYREKITGLNRSDLQDGRAE